MELYRAVRLYVNFFQPSMKLVKKHRTGSHVQRTYDLAQTPYQRLVESGVMSKQHATSVKCTYSALDPVRLLGQIKRLQNALWSRAATAVAAEDSSPQTEARNDIARFRAATCMPPDDADSTTALQTPDSSIVTASRKRRYRRSGTSMGPWTYRTRKDPFEAVRDEMHKMLLEEPDATGKSLLHQLQGLYPDQYPDGMLRTLQRRLSEWRADVIVRVEDSWLEEDALNGGLHPVVLRATVTSETDLIEPAVDTSASSLVAADSRVEAV